MAIQEAISDSLSHASGLALRSSHASGVRRDVGKQLGVNRVVLRESLDQIGSAAKVTPCASDPEKIQEGLFQQLGRPVIVMTEAGNNDTRPAFFRSPFLAKEHGVMARNYYRDQEYRDQNSTARSQYAGRGQGYRQERSGYEGRERDSSDLGPQTAEGIGDYGGYGDDRERAGGYGENFRQGAFYGQRERSYGDFRGGDWQSNRGGISNYSGEPSAGGADRSGRSYGDAARSGSQYGYGATRPSEFSNYTTGSTYGADYGSGAYGRGEYYGGAGQQFGRQYGQQSFRGRGPKGYERSDERLKEIISERLSDDPGIDASDITVEVADKIVKLTGTVSSRRVKYEVEELIERCGGVKDIENQLRVQSPQSWSSQSQQAGGGSSYGTSAGRDFLTRNDGESGSTSGSSTRHS